MTAAPVGFSRQAQNPPTSVGGGSGNGLWEVRTNLPTKRTARVLLCLYREHLVVHGFIKKTRTTSDDDLALARKRQKELER